MAPNRALRRATPLAAAILAVLSMPVAVAAPSRPVDIQTGNSAGRGRIQNPGLACGSGGSGAYWHADHQAELAPNALIALPGDVKFLLELHSDVIRRPNSVSLPPPGPPGQAATAFMPPGQSQVVLENQRGTIRLGTASGTCEAPSVRFNGRTAAANALPWTVAGGTGSYLGVTGNGTLDFVADVDPGADNPWQLTLKGALSVLQPALQATVVRTYWGSLGTDYVTRRVSVTYRIKNNGTGDAFSAKLTSTTSPTAGVTPLGPNNVNLGDLHVGEFVDVTVRYQLGLLQPCGLVILNCNFMTKVNVAWADALDLASQPSVGGIAVKAPNLPPVLP